MRLRLPQACGAAVLLSAFMASPAFAQLAQGELRGTAVDESGLVLPGVTVTAVHIETGTSRTTITDRTARS